MYHALTSYRRRIGVEEVLQGEAHGQGREVLCVPSSPGRCRLLVPLPGGRPRHVPENVEGYEEGAELPAVLLRPEDELQHRLNIVGSHDLSLDVLRDMIKIRYPAMDLVSAHVGALSGILAVQKGIVDLATTHILDEQELVYNIPAAKKYLAGRAVPSRPYRQENQGLLVAQGNPRP